MSTMVGPRSKAMTRPSSASYITTRIVSDEAILDAARTVVALGQKPTIKRLKAELKIHDRRVVAVRMRLRAEGTWPELHAKTDDVVARFALDNLAEVQGIARSLAARFKLDPDDCLSEAVRTICDPVNLPGPDIISVPKFVRWRVRCAIRNLWTAKRKRREVALLGDVASRKSRAPDDAGFDRMIAMLDEPSRRLLGLMFANRMTITLASAEMRIRRTRAVAMYDAAIERLRTHLTLDRNSSKEIA